MASDTSIGIPGLADTIQLIHLQRKSGVLTAVEGDRRVAVSFRHGMIVACEDADHPVQKIGDSLVRGKKLTAVQYREILYHQNLSKEPLASAILNSGYVSPADLERATASHIGEIFMGLFRFKTGAFKFEPKDVTPIAGLVTPLSTEFWMMEGVRRVEEWPYVQKIVPNLNIVFQRTSLVPPALAKALDRPEAELDASDGVEGLSAEEIGVYKLVDGVRDVRSIMEESPLSEFEVCRGLSSLSSAGFIVELSAASSAALMKDHRWWLPAALRPIATAELLPAMGLVVMCILISIKLGKEWASPVGIGQLLRETRAHHAVLKAKLAVNSFELDRGKAPLELGSLVRGGYLDPDAVRDPFSQESLGYTVSETSVDIFSAGPDGKLGSGDDIR